MDHCSKKFVSNPDHILLLKHNKVNVIDYMSNNIVRSH